MADSPYSNFTWWFRLTAPVSAQQYATLLDRQQRERMRRAMLTSIIAPFILIAPLFFIPLVKDIVTALAVIIIMLTSVMTLVLNRFGQQHLAALLLILSIECVIEGALIAAPGGIESGWLPTFDLFAIPLVIAGMLLSRRFVWGFMFLHIAFILGDFYLLRHAASLEVLIKLWNGLGVVFVRPIVIQVGLCLLSYIQLLSTDEAIARADRVEDMAKLEHIMAERRQLEVSAHQLMEIHSQIRRGNYKVRANVPQGNVLWDVSYSLNNLLMRLERDHQISDEAMNELQRTRLEAQRLVDAIGDAKSGQTPSWPAKTGTAIDLIIEQLMLISSRSSARGTQPNPVSKVQQYSSSSEPKKASSDRLS